MNTSLNQLSLNAPLVQPILPLSQCLASLSKEFLLVLEENKPFNKKVMNDLYNQCNSKDHADVELAVCNGLKKLIDNFK